MNSLTCTDRNIQVLHSLWPYDFQLVCERPQRGVSCDIELIPVLVRSAPAKERRSVLGSNCFLKNLKLCQGG